MFNQLLTMLTFLRILLGLVFLVSSVGKLLSPYQNFLYVLQAYQILPSNYENAVAQIFPWVELMVGAFLFLGLWTVWALRGAGVLFGCFVIIVGQALIRKLPLENCGCFGEFIHLNPHVVILMDAASIILVAVLLRHLPAVKKFSLDAFFDKT